MQLFQSTPRPTHTPWGNADEAEQIAPGIWRVSTPSHGGFILSAERRAAMPAYLRAIPTFAGGPNYEEDCDWSIVAMSFPEEFSHAGRVAAIQTFNEWIVPKIGERKSSRGQQSLGGI